MRTNPCTPVRRLALSWALGASLSLVACGGGNASRTEIPATTLSSAYSSVVWEDNFATRADGTPDASLWAGLTGNGDEYGNPGWGNNELQYYLPANATVSGGLLQLRGHADASLAGTLASGTLCAGATCRYSSARLTSLKTVDLSRPGLLEVMAQLPTGTGGWPAIWLLPGQSPGASFPPTAEQLALQPTWPAGGEIDMAEWFSRYFGSDRNSVQVTLHLPGGSTSPYTDRYIYKKTSGLADPVDTVFHRYQLSWTADAITFSLDDVTVMQCARLTLTCSPSDGQGGPTISHWPFGTTWRHYHLLLNLAIGGNLGAPDGDNTAVPSGFDQTLKVAYVRYMVP